MGKLTWLDDEVLRREVGHLLNLATNAKKDSQKKFNKNVVDPFSAIFEMSGFNMSYDDWVISEEARQVQKTLQNSIGEFHQKVLGSCHGWTDLKKGKIIDILNTDRKVIAEVKNKFNTVSGGKLSELYESLSNQVMPKSSIYKGYTAYYVTIIPSSPSRFDTPFTPSNKDKGQKCATNELVRHIDGASFYHLVTGEEKALENLYAIIPDIIFEFTKVDNLDRKKLTTLFSLAYS